jgi:hypothetical protein
MKQQLVLLLAVAVCAPFAAVSAAAASKASTGAKPAVTRSVWPPETISGKLAMVEPDRKLIVVRSPDGVPFDMVITPRTRIMSGNQAVTLQDLAKDQNKSVSIKFVPERRGDVARSIRLQG